MAQPKPVPPTIAATAVKRPRTLAGSVPLQQEASRAVALERYEAAIQLLQRGEYAKAHAAFDKMLESSPPELGDRIRMYISACLLQISKGVTTFQSHEEQCDYAISLLNNGSYPEARQHFKEIIKAHPTADYAFYGLAVLASMTGDASECLEHLTEAIKHNPRNRIQARSDSDFQDMADDPRFTELLYPEV
jgi:tetratricopeptide (TPR) repeat protein